MLFLLFCPLVLFDPFINVACDFGNGLSVVFLLFSFSFVLDDGACILETRLSRGFLVLQNTDNDRSFY